MSATDRLVWADCEMTGLDLGRDELIEIAVIVTDFELQPLDAGVAFTIAPSPGALEQMSDFVRAMHTESGLLDDLPAGIPLAEAEAAVLDYVTRHVPLAGQAPLAGNSIGTDRAFLARHMPRFEAHLHYRNVDVSTVKELTRHWFPRVYFQAPAKHGGHRALGDILDSIRELQYYRGTSFAPAPGPSSEEAQAVAVALDEAAQAAARGAAIGSAPEEG